MSTSTSPQPNRQSLQESLPACDQHAYSDFPSDPSRPLVSSDVEGSALKPRPRWAQVSRFSQRAKMILGAVILALAALVATMIWYGVHRAQESKLDNPADLTAARNMVEPKIFTSLISSDGDLLTSFAFSSPTVSNSSFVNTLDATILTSSSQLLQVPPPISSSSYFVKIFGQRSTNIVFASSSDNSTDWSARVDAFWKVSSGGNQEARKQWGTDQLSKTVGGSYGYKVDDGSDGDSAVGLAMKTVGKDTFGVSSEFPIAFQPDLWLDSSMLFTVTIFVPPTFSARRLDISTAKGDLKVQDLKNATFDSVDVRLGSGSIDTTSSLFAPFLSIFAARGISGSYSLASGTLLSHGSIQLSNLTFTPPSTLPSPSSAYNLTLITINGNITANITSFATSGSYASLLGGVNLNSTSQGGGTDIIFPFDSFDGEFELATNEGLPTVKKALTRGGGTFMTWGGGAIADGKVQKKLNYKFSQVPGGGVDGKGMVRMNADKGNVRLYVVSPSFYNY